MTKPTNDCVPSEDLDHPGHPPSLIKSLCCPHEETLAPKLPTERNAKTLIRLSAGHFVGFDMRRLIYQISFQEENSKLESNIKWADAFILVYSMTDRCSFNECIRLKVVINSSSKRTKNNGVNVSPCLPTVLVGNKSDLTRDRMVSTAEGRARSMEMNCIGFYETSVKEDRDSATQIVYDIFRHCRKPSRRAQLQQRLSYPVTGNLDRRDHRDPGCPRVALQRRNNSLYTIS